jgi:leucyl/phenylalanyl-tRNA--protein transferase
MRQELTPRNLLAAYAAGIFPMADVDGTLFWLAPDPRTVIELDDFRISRSLRRLVERDRFEVTVDRAFADVIDACADRREGTWISKEIRAAYDNLHRLGFAHSVEAWHGGKLAGGLYGVSIGGVFCGESMFYRVSDASKVAMVHFVRRLRERGFVLLDVQFMTEHLRRLGAVEIPRKEYERRLREAIELPCRFCD